MKSVQNDIYVKIKESEKKGNFMQLQEEVIDKLKSLSALELSEIIEFSKYSNSTSLEEDKNLSEFKQKRQAEITKDYFMPQLNKMTDLTDMENEAITALSIQG